MAEPERYRKFATMEAAFKARLRGDRELMCIFWGRWREIMRVWNYMLVMRHDVKRRTFLLDEIREKYLKDVMAVKAALAHAAKNVIILSLLLALKRNSMLLTVYAYVPSHALFTHKLS